MTPEETAAAEIAPEGSAAREAAEHADREATERGEGGERLFGLDTESTGLVATADVITAALALLILLAPAPVALGAIALLTLGFSGAATALDVREALHQHDEGRAGLVGAAVDVAVLHLLCALVATVLLLRARRGTPTRT